MSNHEKCVEIIEEMVELGYNLMGKSASQLADMMGNDVNFFKEVMANYLKWKGDK